MVKVERWDAATESVTVRTMTAREYADEFGADRLSALTAPIAPESEMTDGEKMLANRMQAEEGVNQAAAAAGVESIFDLPSWDDDESIPLDDLVPQEYDGEAADAPRRARQGGDGS